MCNPATLARLYAGRLIANHALASGVGHGSVPQRARFTHLGALLCDSVLQSGLNYHTVVAKRTRRVLESFPYAHDLQGVRLALDRHGAHHFLDWRHQEKIGRFMSLVAFLEDELITSIAVLKEWMREPDARSRLQEVRGIGPKTIDYMACLIGLEQVPIDRHMRAFAQSAGVHVADYDALRQSFAIAADLLNLRQSNFDWWIWTTQSSARAGMRQSQARNQDELQFSHN